MNYFDKKFYFRKKNMKKILAIGLLVLISFWGYSQNSFLLRIENKYIPASEFERLYLKSPTQNVSQQDLQEYLDLFINYNLKLYQAYQEGYDTLSSIRKEHKTYVEQFAESYFFDKDYENKLIQEAYERTKKEVRLSYILIKANKPNDPEALKKANEAYELLTKKKQPFEQVALKYSESNTVKYDKGDGGFIRYFQTPYEIENFAYNAKIGDISKPMYVNGAYFILKITEIRNNPPKEVRVSQIFIRFQEGSSKEDSLAVLRKLDTIKNLLVKGEKFEDLARKYSDDRTSASKDGDLGWFSTGRMYPQFEIASYSIKNIGQWTGPIRTPAGYHFIKLTDIKYFGTFEQEKESITQQLKKNPRYNLCTDIVYERLQKQYNFTQLLPLSDIQNLFDTTLLKGQWKYTENEYSKKPFVKIGDKTYDFEDFALYVQKRQKSIRDFDVVSTINKIFENYKKEIIRTYHIEQLSKTDTAFINIYQEYLDGLIIFEITNNKVWNKANTDTIGLRNFYYQKFPVFLQRIKMDIFECTENKVYSKLLKLSKKSDIDSTMIKKINTKKTLVKFTTGVFKEGENSDVDYVTDYFENNPGVLASRGFPLIVANPEKQKIYKIYDSFEFVRGIVIAEYQEKLMQEWLNQLRNSYNWEINQSVWNEIVSKYLNK